MFLITIEADLQPPRQQLVVRFPCTIGRRRDGGVVLESWRVARVHATLHRIEGGCRLVDGGSLTGTWVNGERIVEFGPVQPADEIVIAGFRLRVLPAGAPVDGASTPDGSAEGAAVVAGQGWDGSASPEEPGARAVPLSGPTERSPAEDQATAWRAVLHQRLLHSIDLRRVDIRQLSSEQLRADARAWLEEILARESSLPEHLDRDALLEDTLDEVVGLGPLERLMADPSISEIMVNSAANIFVERAGRLEPTRLSFSSEAAVRAVIDRIVAPVGRRIDESAPMVDARLADGSRVNAVIAPLAVKGSALTIRRFGRRRLRPDDLVAFGSADARLMRFLALCVTTRRNLVIAGGTGSGKTTLLNVLADFIPAGERLVTIEDSAELSLDHLNLVSLEGRPANAEGRGQVTIRDLVRNALRMRPDRIIVGECRGGEALDMLQAMNTGHEGSLTTVHANSARDVVSRLETMVMMAGMDLPLVAIREQIASAIDIIVQQTRSADGARRIVEVTEITGTEGTRVLMQPLFRYRTGRFDSCGQVPHFFEALGLPADGFLSPHEVADGRAP